jgi:mRNA interferase RelE/StbE
LTYKVEKTKQYYKSLKRINQNDVKTIESAINVELSNDPYGCPNCHKLTLPQHGGEYRLRVRDYRVFYIIDETKKTVIVYYVIHRSNAYS